MVESNTDALTGVLETLQRATQILPGYVSSANYPELEPDQSPEAKFYNDGFREVYAGPSLATLTLDLLPPPLAASIRRQMAYVQHTLQIHNIRHGHDHEDNFNVRFLLSKGGEKKLFFDVNAALQHAIKHKMDLTPIVTLRDWDEGTS